MTMYSILPANARPYKNAYIVDVTPEMAKKWFDGVRFNRTVDYSIVAKYVRQIRSGLWRRTHQGVAFTPEMTLLDGQHRLLAIIRTGVTVPMLVFVNEPRDNFEFIDCGRNRSNLDMIRLGQRNNALSSMHTLTIKAFLAGPSCHVPSWSNAELNIEYEKFQLPINFVVDLFRHEKDKRINDPTVRGMLARAYYSVAPDQISAFATRLLNGNGRGGDPVSEFKFQLREWSDRRESTRREIYKRGVQTFLAFSQNLSDPQRIEFSHDVFPIPRIEGPEQTVE